MGMRQCLVCHLRFAICDLRFAIRVAGASLVGGLMAVAVVSGLRTPVRAAAVAAAAASPGDVVINEVAWAGHAGHIGDEWIELYNDTAYTIALGNWRLYSSDGGPSITLSSDVPPHGYYLIERSNDDTVSDVPADWTGSFGTGLSNSGEVLTLTDHLGSLIDTANAEDGGPWPAGITTTGVITYATMERVDPAAPDTDANWCTNDGVTRNGLDAGGNPINGTPKAQNSCYRPPVSDVADLVVVKSGPAAAAPKSLITYVIAVSNAGSITATAVRVTDTLPADVDLVTQTCPSASSGQAPFTFTHSGRDLVWQLGDVPTGTQHSIIVTACITDTASGTFTNRVTATTTASETAVANNAGSWTTAVLPPVCLYALAPINYDGRSGEAAALINLGSRTVSLGGWYLNDDPNTASGVSFPATATIEAGQVLWLAQNADGFYPVWGFDAGWAAQAVTRPVSLLGGSWHAGFLADDGDTTYLLDAGGNVVDAVAYGTGLASQGWSGPAIPYPYPGRSSGQVLYRKLDQSSGRPVPDMDTAAGWAQDPDDPINGRKVRYPGWDLEELFFPVEVTATAHFTLAAAPEGALDVVSGTIAAARHTLRIQAYTLESVPLYQAISERVRSGVVVTVLLEGNPAGGMEDVERWIVQRLHTPPTSTVYFIGQAPSRYRYQHAKFILVDDRLALVTSDNLGENSMPSDRQDNGTSGHRGFVAVTDSPAVIARLAGIFRLDCDPLHHLDVVPYDDTYAPPGGFTPPLPLPDWTTYTAVFTVPLVTTATHVTVLHAPENALRDQDGLLRLVGRAGSGDKIAMMQMSEPFTWTAGAGNAGLNPRLQALVAAARQGAGVRVLLDEYYDDPLDADGNAAACLRLNGIAAQEGLSLACRLANVTGLGIHAKVFLVSVGDERWVHLGSINGTENANKHNREVALQFRSAEAYEWMRAVFEHDWVLGHAPRPYRTYLPLVMRNYIPPADHPLVSEVFVNPEGDDGGREWIELYNPGPEVTLAGWTIGDAINAGNYGDGRYAFPAGAQLAHGQVMVVAACATEFAAYGFNPAYEWADCDATVPGLVPVATWEGFGLALGNVSDEVLLLDARGSLVDSAAWGGTPRAGVTPFTDFIAYFPDGASLKRYPPGTDHDDCARDFYVSYNPSPGVVAETGKRWNASEMGLP